MKRTLILSLCIIGCLAIFVGRAALAQNGDLPGTFHLFDTLTVAGAMVALVVGRRGLTRRDWLVALAVGAFIGVQAPFATLFTPYPFWYAVRGLVPNALIRGAFTAVAMLGGLAVWRAGGPVRVRAAEGDWRATARSLAFGAAVGLPLAVLNMFANRMTQGRPFDWQSPFAAALDALQPAIYEDVIYRLALIGLVGWLLRRAWPERPAAIIAGVLATLVHAYSHMDDLFLTQPLVALGMGAVMALIWGAPMTWLALRRDLESSVAFHWIQDALRFLAGL